ncbi:MAG: RHS repeat protein, partial [Candidatus Rokubacteria bacterium]|nr:RHS repeat protein [Candidatus Rokubacteria bacterium]
MASRLVGALCLALIPTSARAALPEVSNVRFQDQETLAWDASGSVAGYHVYSGTISALGGLQPADCRQGSLRGTSTRIQDPPPPGVALYVLVVGFDESQEGPAGTSTSGVPRAIQTHCIPARRNFRFALNGDPGDGVIDGDEPRRNASVRAYDLGSSGRTGVLLHTGEFVLRASDDVRRVRRAVAMAIDRLSTPSIPYDPDDEPFLQGRLQRMLEQLDIDIWFSIEGTPGAYLPIPDPPIQASLEAAPTETIFARTYQSQVQHDGPMGYGWDFGANARLAPVGQNVLHFDGEGRQEFFFRSGPTSFVSPLGQFSMLLENPDGSFALRSPQGRLSNFHAFDGSNREGALESLEDRNGNRVTYQYDFQGLLTSVTDALGRGIRYRYNAEGRIVDVSDFSGRSWIYSYDADGNLVSVETPGAGGAAGGRTTTYTYSSGFSDPRLNHNLLSVIRPNEVGTAVPALQNTYGTDPLAFAFDRVVSQAIGGTNASGVPAGGVLNYTYASLNPGGDPFDLSLPRRQAAVLDRNGNEKVLVHNRLGNLLSATERTNREVRPGEPDYTTRYAHDQDGNLRAVQWPQGNGLLLTYDSPGADRYREGNLLEVRFLADPVAFGGRGDGRGAEIADRVFSFTFDPVFDRIRSFTDERGKDPGYVPQNGGAWSPERYTTRFWYDYQEGDPASNGIAALASRFGIALGGTLFNMGDLNGDGIATQASGNVVQ